LPKKNYAALKSKETISKKEEKKSSCKDLKVGMIEFDGSDNSSGGSTNDEVVFMSKKFKHMLIKKAKF